MKREEERGERQKEGGGRETNVSWVWLQALLCAKHDSGVSIVYICNCDEIVGKLKKKKKRKRKEERERGGGGGERSGDGGGSGGGGGKRPSLLSSGGDELFTRPQFHFHFMQLRYRADWKVVVVVAVAGRECS